VTTITDIELQIRAFKAEHGYAPTHIIIPGSLNFNVDDCPLVQGVKVVEVFDPAIKTILVARCSQYAIN